MFISLYIMIITAVLLVLALATPLFSPFFRRIVPEEGYAGIVRNSEDNEEESEHDAETPYYPPISVVLTAHDSSYHLSQVLPLLLDQKYSGDYQIIVVIDRNDSDSEDILKLHSPNPHLYYTMIPVTSRYLSRKKLGLTLGIRAAKHDWVLVTDVHSLPSSNKWLANMARHCAPDINMVLGLSLYGSDSPSYYRYEQLRTMLYYLRSAQRKCPFSTNQSAIMLRKSEFFEQNGFRGNLEYTRAEFEFLVNKLAQEGACAIAIEPEARMKALKPSPKRWLMRQLYALDALRGMQRSATFKLLFHWDLCMMHLYNIATIAAFIFGMVLSPSTDGMVLQVSAILLWIISNIERYIIYRPVLRYFNNVSPSLAIIMDWTISLRNFIMQIKYHFADKNDFITHKL